MVSGHCENYIRAVPAHPPASFSGNPRPQLARVGTLSSGSNAMRSVLALGLWITLCASVNAATVHHPMLRHVIVRPSQGWTSRDAVPNWDYVRARPPVHYDDTPSYNDPSKFGGQSLGIDP